MQSRVSVVDHAKNTFSDKAGSLDLWRVQEFNDQMGNDG
jgi:hypothetical protein